MVAAAETKAQEAEYQLKQALKDLGTYKSENTYLQADLVRSESTMSEMEHSWLEESEAKQDLERSIIKMAVSEHTLPTFGPVQLDVAGTHGGITALEGL